ncbi:MAG: outer membrane lipoprotein carrier protein LolA [Rhodospirillales bacterium]|nr:outer membrane lipoprotein carrier protein LolA [Rhodospirillales bacterium]
MKNRRPHFLARLRSGSNGHRALFVVAALVAITMANLPAYGAEAASAKLSPRDKADIARIEDYLNRLHTMTAKFLQVASTGEVATGKVYLSRPGKMRFEYDPPSPLMLIADGTFLIQIDRELDETTHIFLSSTPVGFLVAKDVKFSGDVTVTGIRRGPNTMRVHVVNTEDPEKGSLTLVFSDKPLALYQWQVKDAQSIRTSVSLTSMRTGMKLDGKLFEYEEKSKNQ